MKTLKHSWLPLLLVSVGAFSQSPSSPDTDDLTGPDRKLMIERHEKVAGMHKKMADCLKTDKSFEQCHERMREACPMNELGDYCPMMGKSGWMGRHHRYRHGDEGAKAGKNAE